MSKRDLFSFSGRLALVAATALALGVGLALGLAAFFDREHAWLAAAAALLFGIPLAVLGAHAVALPLTRFLGALTDGLTSLRDGDFSLSLARPRGLPESAELADAYNGLGARFRAERRTLVQRELLLDTVIQATPLALVLTTDTGAVIYSNFAARRLFQDGRPLEGHSFNALLESSATALREAIAGGQDTLFTMPVGEEPEIFHLSLRRFALNARIHHLYLLKQLTRELNAQEVLVWKRVIRVIAHELNNSLAPISSLAHSGRQLAHAPEPAALERVFATIEERAAHLQVFIDGYARFAKLPRPRPERVEWPSFIERLRATNGFAIATPLPAAPAWFDTAQLEQALINLLKNAHESGSAPEAVELGVAAVHDGVEIVVLDRGAGMAQAVLEQALLPFYSTKANGTGLGLTLSREIIEAHGGRLVLAPREHGGTSVSVWLPSPGVAN
jgi:two-component system, NtrC family, nitrogen regulation sensor histidine kinase NtrY